jgi:hypothetical protein
MFSDDPLVNKRCMAFYKFFLFFYVMILMSVNGIDYETLQIRSSQAFSYLKSLRIETVKR